MTKQSKPLSNPLFFGVMIIGLITAVLFGYYYFTSIHDLFSNHVPTSITLTNSSFVVYCCLFLTLLLTLSTLRYRLLSQGKLTISSAFNVAFFEQFFAAIIPFSLGSKAASLFFLNRSTVPFGKATSIAIITSFLDRLTTLILIPVLFFMLFYLEPTLVDTPFIIVLFVGGSLLLPFVICILLYLSIFSYPNLFKQFLLLCFKLPFISQWTFIAKEWGNDVERSFKELRHTTTFSFWIKSCALSIGMSLCRLLCVFFILATLNWSTLYDGSIFTMKHVILDAHLTLFNQPIDLIAFDDQLAYAARMNQSTITSIVSCFFIWKMISKVSFIGISAVVLPIWVKRNVY